MDKFKADLKKAIEDKIRDLKKDGTVGMGMANLKMVVRPPLGGPSGTNCQWVYNEFFNEAVKSSSIARSFTY